MTLDAADRDPSTSPGDDFYRFANGGWLDANPIPPGYGSWGAFEEIGVRNEVVLHDLLQRAAEAPADALDRLLGNQYAAGMDLEAVEAQGVEPIRPFLAAIAEAPDHDALVALLPDLHRHGITAFFGVGVTVDHDDATRHLLWLVPAGLGLPDRESYLADTDAAVELRAAYVDHVAAQLANAGTETSEAARLAPLVLELETRLAGHHLKAEQRRDPDNTLNRHTREELAALAPALDLPGYLAAIGAGEVASTNVEHPPAFAALHDEVVATDLAAVRAYLTFHVVHTTASSLGSTFDDEAFSFYGRRISGKQVQQERYKRVVAAITEDLGEALSQRYVATAFPPSAKDRALEMVEAIREEMRRSIETRPWMGEETRARGLAKLDALTVKIGYPDRWRDWSGLELDRTSFAANRLAATTFDFDWQIGKLAEPVDETEWEMPPHVVNAYYHPTRNEIVFPAGILQPPMFDADADDAVNFGGIGTVIAHEITHGFDDQGRRFDADGAFRDWWTTADQERFTAMADRLAEQFDGYEVLGELPVNGRLTLGENIADLGGVTLAQRAHARVASETPEIDGLTPAQRFFLAAATLWRANVSEELQRTLVQVDPHSPRHLRVRGPFSNLQAFQDAWGLPDDAPMLRARGERIEIW